jgi:integrase
MVVLQDQQPSPIPEEPTRWGPTTTVNDAIAAWKDNGWDDLSPKTVRGYESVWSLYIRDSIGRRRIASLSTYDVERHLHGLKRSGLGFDTVRHVRNMLNRSCRLARKWSAGVLANPVQDSELPKWSFAERGEVRAPEVTEVMALLRELDNGSFDLRFAVFVRLLVATGMRRGEGCAIRWSDVDEASGAVQIDESVITSSGGAMTKSPKTRASIRRTATDDTTMRALASLREEQRLLAEMAGRRLEPDSFVFSFEPGGRVPPHPDAMTKSFTKLRTKAAVAKDVHLHSLRHFHATALDPVISARQKQARLGWSTVRMARHYTDAIGEEDRRAAVHIGRLLDADEPS